MPQDAFTLKYLCNELNSLLKNGKVNKIVQPNNDEVILTIYTGKRTEKLLISVNPSCPRIGIINEEKVSPLTAPNFCMLLRKHVLSAVIESISLVGFDRIVKIVFLYSGEFCENVKKTMYIELMGRYSNIILTENGKILGGNRGINLFEDVVRPLIVGKKYVFPPVGDKKVPKDSAIIEYINAYKGENFANYICSGVQGLALSTSQEIVSVFNKGYIKENGENFGEKFFNFLNDYIENCNVKPCVLTDKGVVVDMLIYPYESVEKKEIKYFNSLIEAEDFFFNEKGKNKNFNAKKERYNALINGAIKKAKKKLTALKSKEKDALNAEENKLIGELILANIYKIKYGDEKVIVDNYYDNSKMEITLDKTINPSQNAESYFKKYNKQKRTLLALAPQKEQVENELNYFNSLLDEVSICENIDDLNVVREELIISELLKENSPKNKREKELPFRNYFIDGFNVRVGRNNIENDKLLGIAKAEDIWLHAKDYHSSFVIIESQNKKVKEETIIKCAEICAYYSKGREGGKTEIVYTQKKYVKKTPKAKLGFVIYENFSSIMVNPLKHEEKLK